MQYEKLGRGRCSGGKMTERKAEAAREAKQVALSNGEAPVSRPPATTLLGFTAELIESLRLDLRQNTLEEYRIAAQHLVQAIGGDIQLAQIDWRHVGRLKSHLQKRSGATVRKNLILLRAIFYRAVKRGLIQKNPFARVELPPAAVKEARIFARDEIDILVTTAPSQW
jgi:site-specific recombinase XerD